MVMWLLLLLWHTIPGPLFLLKDFHVGEFSCNWQTWLALIKCFLYLLDIKHDVVSVTKYSKVKSPISLFLGWVFTSGPHYPSPWLKSLQGVTQVERARAQNWCKIFEANLSRISQSYEMLLNYVPSIQCLWSIRGSKMFVTQPWGLTWQCYPRVTGSKSVDRDNISAHPGFTSHNNTNSCNVVRM